MGDVNTKVVKGAGQEKRVYTWVRKRGGEKWYLWYLSCASGHTHQLLQIEALDSTSHCFVYEAE